LFNGFFGSTGGKDPTSCIASSIMLTRCNSDAGSILLPFPSATLGSPEEDEDRLRFASRTRDPAPPPPPLGASFDGLFDAAGAVDAAVKASASQAKCVINRAKTASESAQVLISS